MGRRRICYSFLGALLAVALSSCSLAAYFPKNYSSSSASLSNSSTLSSASSTSSQSGSSSLEEEQRDPLDFDCLPLTEKYGYRYLLENEEKGEGLCGLYGALDYDCGAFGFGYAAHGGRFDFAKRFDFCRSYAVSGRDREKRLRAFENARDRRMTKKGKKRLGRV